MITNLKRIAIVFIVTLFFSLTINAQKPRNVISLDNDWKFSLGDHTNAEKPSFNDAAWRQLNVPHDWSIEGEYSPQNTTGRGGGYLPAGIGWYRKQLVIPVTEKNKKIFLEFDGVMANSDVWINGVHLGKRPYGYTSFSYEITENVKFGTTDANVISVRVDNSDQPASRWYAGAGIYRHVRLVSLNEIHFEKWGIFITTPEVNDNQAKVKIQTSVVNQSTKSSELTIQTTISSAEGKQIKTKVTKISVNAGNKAQSSEEITIDKPLLWDTEKPNLYSATTSIYSGKTLVDEQTNIFGIREFKFEASTGFWLNGKNQKILGVCLHQDGGPVGVAVPLSVWERRLLKLKEIGVNAIRTAHNPMEPAFYDLCDKMGFLVMNESFDTWTVAKPNGTRGYNLYFNEWWEADTRDMVMRDRNHPSIIIYSIGNEIRDRLDREDGKKRFLDQRDLVHSLDPTRPVTLALFRPNEMKVYENGFAELMDIVGQNYRETELIAAWKSKPERKVIGTENRHDNATWLYLRDNPFMSGQFLWTGIDYLGEANWPEISWGSALLDRNGFTKPAGYERQSWWSKKPMVKIVRSEDNGGKGGLKMDWTPADFGTYDEAYIYVYSNCEEVELFLNNESKGKLPINKDASPRFWNIGFEPGTIKAVGYNSGKEVVTDIIKTAETADKIILSVEKTTIKNNWDDLIYVKASLIDKNGNVNPNFNPVITFTVSSEGILNSVDNSNITSHEKYKTNSRTAYNGQALALIQAKAKSGFITVTANAEGYKSNSIKIEIKP